MLVGYNHNIGYKGEVFHVQTEDSGINTPHIITLLYRGGNILASKKTSYADIVKMGNLSQVVEELMKEQHKDMLRRLKNGEFDERLGLGGVSETPPAKAPETPPAPVPPVPAAAPPKVEAVPATTQAAPPQTDIASKKQSLDDLIFDFLSAGDERH
jgi:hypothetical protein